MLNPSILQKDLLSRYVLPYKKINISHFYMLHVLYFPGSARLEAKTEVSFKNQHKDSRVADQHAVQ